MCQVINDKNSSKVAQEPVLLLLKELKSEDRIFGYFKGNRTVLQVLGSHVLHSLIQFQGNRTDICLFESGCT